MGVIMGFNFGNIGPYVGYFVTYFAAIDIVKQQIKKGLKSYKNAEIDVFGFYNSVLNEELKLGDTISATGFLMEHAQLFKPYSYINSVWKPTSEDEMVDFNIKYKGTNHELRQNELLFERNQIIVPVQKIPVLGNVHIAFLYDERFRSFNTSNNPDTIVQTGKSVIKDKYSDPIMVVYDKNRHPNILKNYVHIKNAKVIRGAEVINRYFKEIININDTFSSISNIYRPLKMGNDIICVSLLEDESRVEIIESGSEILGDEFKVPFFIEGTFNSLYSQTREKSIKVIEKMAPNDMKYYNHLPSLHDEIDEAISFISTSGINITFREPGTIGFYSELKYFNTDEYEKKIFEVSGVVNNFAIDYKNFARKEFGVKDKFNVTFMYDYSYRNLFKSKVTDTSFSNVMENEKIFNEFSDNINVFTENP